jgi:Ca-activated chloride channel homolog
MKDLHIQYPWALLLLVAVPLLLYARRKIERRTAFAGVFRIPARFQPGFFKRRGGDLFLALFLVCSLLAVANLQYSTYWQRSFLESKWIMLVQDLSGSMYRPSLETGTTLADVALEGSRAFVDLREKDDLIGIIAFSSFAKLVCPPTFDREILRKKLRMLGRESDSIVFRQLAVGGATNASYAAWLAMCVFFMLLPEENQLSFQEMNDLRFTLLGETLRKVIIPEKLKQVKFGHGMAVVLFTDGRIEANKSEEDVRKGLPNFVNVLELFRRLGVRLYLISVSGEVNTEVQEAFEAKNDEGTVGRIFYMPRRFDEEQMREVYTQISEMERNKLLTQLSRRKKDTRWVFNWAAFGSLLTYGFFQVTPRFRRI